MEHIKGFNSFEEISEKNGIKDATKGKGAIGKKDEKITKAEIDKKTAELKKKDQDKKQLSKKDAKSIKEGFETSDLQSQFYDIISNNSPEEAAELCAQLVNDSIYGDNTPRSNVGNDEWLDKNRGNIIKNFATESRKHR